MTQKTQPNYTFALTVVIIVCFLIGFVTTMNNSMIGFCKTVFNLTEAQGQLVNSAFYGAYALSIPFALMMNKIGYKMTLVLGLAVVGLGFVINYFGISTNLDAAQTTIYNIFLASMCGIGYRHVATRCESVRHGVRRTRERGIPHDVKPGPKFCSHDIGSDVYYLLYYCRQIGRSIKRK